MNNPTSMRSAISALAIRAGIAPEFRPGVVALVLENVKETEFGSFTLHEDDGTFAATGTTIEGIFNDKWTAHPDVFGSLPPTGPRIPMRARDIVPTFLLAGAGDADALATFRSAWGTS